MPTWLLSLAAAEKEPPGAASDALPMETDGADETDATAAAAAPTPETMNMWKLEARQQLANYRRLARNLGPLPRSSSQSVSFGKHPAGRREGKRGSK